MLNSALIEKLKQIGISESLKIPYTVVNRDVQWGILFANLATSNPPRKHSTDNQTIHITKSP